VALANAMAPESAVAAFFGLFMLPAAFIGGFYTWLGLALLDAIGQFLRRRRGATAASPAAAPVHPRAVPPGSVSFVFTSLGVATLVGFGIAFLSTGLKFSQAWGTVIGVGIGYGVLCWNLARSGFLPFPEGG
jgi:hypothetical protein